MRKSIDAMGSSSCHSPAHCFDESPAGYSWVGCSPAEPTCASPAESIMPNRRSIEKRNDRNAPFHPTPLTKNCKGCPGTNCKGCLGTGHGVGLLGWSADRRGITVAQFRSRGAQRALREKGWVGLSKMPHPHCRRLEQSRRRSDNKNIFMLVWDRRSVMKTRR